MRNIGSTPFKDGPSANDVTRGTGFVANTSWILRLWLLWLLAYTANYVLFGQAVVHPVDARSGAPLLWMHLQFPLWGAAVEPLAALGHIAANAPDIRVALKSMFFWSIALAAVLAWWRTRRLRTTAFAVASVAGLMLLYDTFTLLTLLPTWRLVVDEPGMVVADLHSHTYSSHDGFISPAGSLRAHRDHGFDVVAITDHDRPEGGFAAWRFQRTQRPDLPGVLPGIEIHGVRGAVLLGIGLKPDKPLALSLDNAEQMQQWIRQVHEAHQGAVIALSWHMSPADLAWLADMGVDAIEIANAGHPGMLDSARGALSFANASERYRLPLVASSDFHGWSNFWHTWTVIRPKEKDDTSPAAAVLSALREHRAPDITPVSAHPMEAMSLAGAIGAPFLGAFEYGRDLSLPRLLSWWGWIALLALIAGLLRRNGWRPGVVLLAALVAVMSGSLLFHGVMLLSVWWQGLTFGNFVCRLGIITLALGGIAWLVAGFMLLLKARRRRDSVHLPSPGLARRYPSAR